MNDQPHYGAFAGMLPRDFSPIEMVEPDPPVGDQHPRHMCMPSVDWPDPVGEVLRPDRAVKRSCLPCDGDCNQGRNCPERAAIIMPPTCRERVEIDEGWTPSSGPWWLGLVWELAISVLLLLVGIGFPILFYFGLSKHS